MSTTSFHLPALPTTARVRTALVKIPLATKVFLAIILLFWLISYINGFPKWAQLAPDLVFGGGAHRLSTYPFLHLGLFHTVINVLALAPLLERFELENGTLVTALLFSGPFSSFPGVLYTLICKLFSIKTPVQGASIWTFLLLTSTLYRASLTTPYISLPIPTLANSSGAPPTTPNPYRIPTALLPLIAILVTAFIIPGTSLLGHLCGALIGYGWGAGILKFLAPPEKILRWAEEKLQLRARLPGSYVAVDRSSGGRYGLLPTRENGNVELGTVGGSSGGFGEGSRHE
ncbi:putative rhomboid family protein [Microthyrium microscopicum]|uniref:rhomboid protease n=1 Tax=Microthyrium microscopicum TaxID=703497 RepID=A0A6A6U623_9PEZI|nr:putative rhomboid family protein [Microthyrium microscopicum]